MSDGTDRGAAMTVEAAARAYLAARDAMADVPYDHHLHLRKKHALGELRTALRSTGEPSPDSAALGCPTGGVCGLSEDVCHCTDMSVLLDEYERRVFAAGEFQDGESQEAENAHRARADVDDALVSLLARLTAAERDAERLTRLAQIEHASLDQYREHLDRAAVVDRALGRRDGSGMRAALPPAGDTGGEQP